ncbi:MAG: GTPase ObgE [Deltaproteobacteria bacterium]|nr:GTPase ObgE [Deltaproteobacteria bacterium]
MKFIDEALITVQSGNGGRGCVSLRREKYVPRGGPDGGDGGKGGDVILRSSLRRRTLYPFQFKRQFKAQNGAHGQGKQKTGKNGQDLIIEIPPGTLVKDAVSGEVIKDFTATGESLTVVKGGRGGLGNARFKTSTNRTPRYAQPGETGQFRQLKLELKLLADVGIIGLPNAGKSTLISVISSATPKIANYPFTTLTPTLGVVATDWGDPFVVADIPGLIEGAHQGAGLGTQFLRHIERTRILIHLIDAGDIDPEDPRRHLKTVNRELGSFNPQLTEKPQILTLNKMDLPGAPEAAEAFVAALDPEPVFLISAKENRGIKRLLSRTIELIDQTGRNERDRTDSGK